MPVFGLVMGGVVVASLAGLALWARHSPAPRQHEAPSVPPVHVAPLPEPVTSAPAQAEAPQPSVQGAPSQPATPARGAAIHSESRPRAQARALAPEDEIALIMEARRELRAGHTRRSLALLRRHRRRFTHGLLVQEREALTIEASLQARDVDGARRRAARFFLRYPGSDEGCFCGGGETQSCFNGMYPNRGVGACADGVQACDATSTMEFGHWGACTMDTLPAEEACDGVDNDCDGAIDEGCPCTAGQTQGCGSEFAIAPCSSGTQTCGTDGTWSACEGAIGPSAEVCGPGGSGDGIDNDCDGMTDEGCTCVPEPEVCGDGLDNDCDGTVDEDACATPEPDAGIDAGIDGSDGGTTDGSVLDSDIVDTCSPRYSHAVALAGDLHRMCALIDDGQVYCWGDNFLGGLGLGERMAPEHAGVYGNDHDYTTRPLRVPGITNASTLVAGNDSDTCVLVGASVRCWGRLARTNLDSMGHWTSMWWTPTRPPALDDIAEDIAEVAAGHAGAIVRTVSGKVWRWGQLGPYSGSSTAPVRVPIDDAIDLGFNWTTYCAVRADHSVWCAGDGSMGVTGPPYGGRFRADPVRIEGLSDVVNVEVGRYFACALHADHTVSCWGADGMRGNGDVLGGDGDLSPTPELVAGLSDVTRLVTGTYSTCAIKTDGTLWCWGSYEVVRAPGYSHPVQMTEVSDVVDVAVGSVVGVSVVGPSLIGQICALESCGRVVCWGAGTLGTNGDGRPLEGNSAPSATPVDVVDLP